MIPVPEYAAKTAAVIRERGWVGGKPEDDEGHVCILRATFFAFGPGNSGKADFFDFCHEIKNRVGQEPEDWNDEPGRTADEVLALLDDMAAS